VVARERDEGPIGVFDSGVGGLTVLRALQARLPGESFIYLGDTARLPYGSKSRETVERYSLQCAHVLVARGVRTLVVACNTASAAALPALRAAHPGLDVFGVIEPGAAAAVRATASRRIAVIATLATVQGRAYELQIQARAPDAQVRALACPLFVALAEEGWTEGPVAEAVARRYLAPLFEAAERPDVLVLGCTHFPLLRPVIRAAVPPDTAIVDSAETTAAEVAAALWGSRDAAGGSHQAPDGACGRPDSLQDADSLRQARDGRRATRVGRITWLATDGAERFAQVGSRFLGRPIEPHEVELVDL